MITSRSPSLSKSPQLFPEVHVRCGERRTYGGIDSAIVAVEACWRAVVVRYAQVEVFVVVDIDEVVALAVLLVHGEPLRGHAVQRIKTGFRLHVPIAIVQRRGTRWSCGDEQVHITVRS